MKNFHVICCISHRNCMNQTYVSYGKTGVNFEDREALATLCEPPCPVNLDGRAMGFCIDVCKG